MWLVDNSTTDPFRLARFVEAQARNFADALAELEAGAKRSHWMWYVFPQLAGLGLSPTAEFYGIGSRDEARAYLAHPLLGPRLDATTRAVLSHPGRSLQAIFGSPDDMKFRSSMTLFADAANAADGPASSPLPPGEGNHAQHGGEGSPAGKFATALATFCAGTPCPRTLALLAEAPPR